MITAKMILIGLTTVGVIGIGVALWINSGSTTHITGYADAWGWDDEADEFLEK